MAVKIVKFAHIRADAVDGYFRFVATKTWATLFRGTYDEVCAKVGNDRWYPGAVVAKDENGAWHLDDGEVAVIHMVDNEWVREEYTEESA